MDSRDFKHISVRVTHRLDRWLRIEAAKRDVSKSALMRDILSDAARLPEEIDAHEYSWRDTEQQGDNGQ